MDPVVVADSALRIEPLSADCAHKRMEAGVSNQVFHHTAVSYTHLTLPTILRV